MVLALDGDSVHGEELITALQATMAIGNASYGGRGKVTNELPFLFREGMSMSGLKAISLLKIPQYQNLKYLLTWNNPGDVDWRVLLLAPHDIEAQTLVRLWQLHDPRMRVALAGCEGGHRRLGGRRRPYLGVALHVDRLVDVLVNLAHGVEELGLKHFLQSRQLRRRNLAH